MKSRFGKWLFYGIAAVAVVLVVAYVLTVLYYQRERDAAVALVRKEASEHAPQVLDINLQQEQQGAAEEAGAGAASARDPKPYWSSLLETNKAFRTAESMEVPPWHEVPLERLTKAEWAELRDFLQKRQELIEEARALAERGGPAYPVDYSEGFDAELPHHYELRDLARLLVADVAVAVHDGDIAHAVDSAAAAVKLGDVLADEPMLMSQLVRFAVADMGIAAVEALPPGALSESQRRQIVGSMGGANFQAVFAECLWGEAQIALESMQQQRRGTGPEAEQGGGVEALFRFLGQPTALMDEVAYVDMIARVAEESRRPYHEAQPRLAALEEELEGTQWLHPTSSDLIPALVRSFAAATRTQAQADLAQIGLLLEQYRQQHGVYPRTLDAIAPELPGSLPSDPFTGQPYQYQVTGDGFRLYSLGADMEDDGGVHDYRDGDIVWRGN